MQEAAERFIMPRFQQLSTGDIHEKTPGEVVTLADQEVEGFLIPVLHSLLPHALIVGEESAATDAGLIVRMKDAESVWLVDPLDGTSNFVAGSNEFAVMVGLIEKERTTHAWIWRPVDKESWVAVRGSGVIHNNERVGPETSASSETTRLRGSVRTRFLDEEHRAFVDIAATQPGADFLPGSGCAGVDYPEVLLGNQDFVLFRRTLPWDHAPGALILEEGGGVVRRWDNSTYIASDDREGILAARSQDLWERAADVLLQSRHREIQP